MVEADATTWDAGGALFDAVLLDAPCTATGTIRRHPDVPYLKRFRDVAPMAELQRGPAGRGGAAAGPGRAAGPRHLFPAAGGRGGASGAAAVLGLLPDPVRPEEVPGLEHAITAAGAVRTRPDFWSGQGGMDGFFMARFRARG